MGYGKGLRLRREAANDAIGSVGCPRRIVMWGIASRGVRYDGVKITRLGVNEIKLLGLKDSLFFSLGSFSRHILGNERKEGLEEPIEEDPVI